MYKLDKKGHYWLKVSFWEFINELLTAKMMKLLKNIFCVFFMNTYSSHYPGYLKRTPTSEYCPELRTHHNSCGLWELC